MRVYLDMDGVIADFDTAATAILGAPPREVPDEVMWPKLLGTPNFFRNLPLMPQAREFVDQLEAVHNLTPIILTACPKSDYHGAAKQKRGWVRQHFGDLIVLPVLGKLNKPLFMHRHGDILIDDHRANCEAWTEAGGFAILHRDFQDTWKQLNQRMTERAALAMLSPA